MTAILFASFEGFEKEIRGLRNSIITGLFGAAAADVRTMQQCHKSSFWKKHMIFQAPSVSQIALFSGIYDISSSICIINCHFLKHLRYSGTISVSQTVRFLQFEILGAALTNLAVLVFDNTATHSPLPRSHFPIAGHDTHSPLPRSHFSIAFTP